LLTVTLAAWSWPLPMIIRPLPADGSKPAALAAAASRDASVIAVSLPLAVSCTTRLPSEPLNESFAACL
jgi:hypothetical protein